MAIGYCIEYPTHTGFVDTVVGTCIVKLVPAVLAVTIGGVVTAVLHVVLAIVALWSIQTEIILVAVT